MDTPQWPQGIGVVIEKPGAPGSAQKKPSIRPQKDQQPLNCPRCNSTNTKFCYYNNYSLSQPRYFCKTCRRYWTDGGTLRNIPVGGGSRKNKRPNSNCPQQLLSSKKVADLSSPPSFSSQDPKIHPAHDLNLGFNPPPHFDGVSEFVATPFGMMQNLQNPNFSHGHHLPVMELFKRGDYVGPRGVSSLVSAPAVCDANLLYGFSPVSDQLKPSLGFSSGEQTNGYSGNMQRIMVDHHHKNSSSSSVATLFPFEELKPVSSSNEFGQERGQEEATNGYWNVNGMLAGGSW